jgi:hypothetical protein
MMELESIDYSYALIHSVLSIKEFVIRNNISLVLHASLLYFPQTTIINWEGITGNSNTDNLKGMIGMEHVER